MDEKIINLILGMLAFYIFKELGYLWLTRKDEKKVNK